MSEVKVKRDATEIKNEIFDLVKEYYQEVFADKKFIPGETNVPVAEKFLTTMN